MSALPLEESAVMRISLGIAFIAASFIAAPISTYAAARQTTAAMPSDHALDERIEKRLEGSSLKKFDVKVSVNDHVVTLTGMVATEAQRTRATQLATVPGVARVDNQLIVDSAAPKKGTMGTIETKTKDGAEKVADKTKEGLSKTGEVITDGWITTRVHSKFVDEDLLKGSDITVDTKDHVVTLRGTVTSAAARARAVEQATEVEGVHRVVDRLTIGMKK